MEQKENIKICERCKKQNEKKYFMTELKNCLNCRLYYNDKRKKEKIKNNKIKSLLNETQEETQEETQKNKNIKIIEKIDLNILKIFKLVLIKNNVNNTNDIIKDLKKYI